MALAAASGYAKLVFAVFVWDADRDDGESYFLREIFANESDLDNFKYIMGRTTYFRVMMASLIQYAWEHAPPPTFP